ncbi:unnamed protein product [Dovyalis caffra]|uniref:Uncharacterized protein n=1 Tax=Dovyalis caffra TaxID=77055 RepID=A0AAV1RAC4_9ROSI|nr:unnamed protein product [Dovyalis caffra]
MKDRCDGKIKMESFPSLREKAKKERRQEITVVGVALAGCQADPLSPTLLNG